MGFFDNWTITETPTKPKEPKTWEEVVNKSIDDQRKIANGEKLRGTKKIPGTDEYPLRPSWYKEDRNVIVPTIGIFPILGSQKSIECKSNDEYKKFLDMLNYKARDRACADNAHHTLFKAR